MQKTIHGFSHSLRLPTLIDFPSVRIQSMDLWGDISSILVATVTFLSLGWVGYRRWLQFLNRDRDRLIALIQRVEAQQQATLPPCWSAEFDPRRFLNLTVFPDSFTVTSVLAGKDVPGQRTWHNRRVPAAVLQTRKGPVAIVVAADTDGALTDQTGQWGEYEYVLGFDPSCFRKTSREAISPNSTKLLQDILNRCHWLTAGPRIHLAWVPYAATYLVCENPQGTCGSLGCSNWGSQTLTKFVPPMSASDGRDYSLAERLFYATFGVGSDAPDWKDRVPGWQTPELVREVVYRQLATGIGSTCEHTATDPGGDQSVLLWAPNEPERVFLELGWVLVRIGPSGEQQELPDCRVRLTPDGYQAVTYRYPLTRWPSQDNPAAPQVIDAFQQQWNWQTTELPCRLDWNDAAQDAVARTFPKTVWPLPAATETWRPEESTRWLWTFDQCDR